MAAEPTPIDLDPIVAPDGTTIWTTPASGVLTPAIFEPGLPASTGPHAHPQAQIVVEDGELDVPGSTRSSLPRDRMASHGTWDRIISSIARAEAGDPEADEIVVVPGGGLIPVRRGEAGDQLSKVSRVRMASRRTIPPVRAIRAIPANLEEARELDPRNVEGWRFIDDEKIPGLAFHMAPVAQEFHFFTFRSAVAAGRWYLSVLKPRFDELVGHEAHVMNLNLGGGDRIPIVCRNTADSSHATIAEVRGTAAKFALYHSLRAYGHVPFSG